MKNAFATVILEHVEIINSNFHGGNYVGGQAEVTVTGGCILNSGASAVGSGFGVGVLVIEEGSKISLKKVEITGSRRCDVCAYHGGVAILDDCILSHGLNSSDMARNNNESDIKSDSSRYMRNANFETFHGSHIELGGPRVCRICDAPFGARCVCPTLSNEQRIAINQMSDTQIENCRQAFFSESDVAKKDRRNFEFVRAHQFFWIMS